MALYILITTPHLLVVTISSCFFPVFEKYLKIPFFLNCYFLKPILFSASIISCFIYTKNEFIQLISELKLMQRVDTIASDLQLLHFLSFPKNSWCVITRFFTLDCTAFSRYLSNEFEKQLSPVFRYPNRGLCEAYGNQNRPFSEIISLSTRNKKLLFFWGETTSSI